MSMFFEGWGLRINVMIKTVKDAIIPDVVIVPSKLFLISVEALL